MKLWIRKSVGNTDVVLLEDENIPILGLFNTPTTEHSDLIRVVTMRKVSHACVGNIGRG